MNKNPISDRLFLVEVEVASTVIGNPYVDLAPPDCMGRWVIWGCFGGRCGVYPSANAPGRISLS